MKYVVLTFISFVFLLGVCSAGSRIPPNNTIIFEVENVGIEVIDYIIITKNEENPQVEFKIK